MIKTKINSKDKGKNQEEKEKKDLGFKKIAFMLKFIKGNQFSFSLGLILISSISFVKNIFTGQLYGAVTSLNQSSDIFFKQLIEVFFVLLFLVVTAVVGHWLFTRATAHADKNLRIQLAYKMSRMPMKNWYERHSGEWLTILGKDSEKAIAGFNKHMVFLVATIIEIIGGTVILAFVSPSIFLYAIISGLTYSGIGILQRKRYKKFAKTNQQATASATSYITDILNGFIVVRIYSLLNGLLEKHSQAVNKGHESGKKIAKVSIINSVLSQIGYTIAYSGTLIIGLIIVNNGQLNLSDMMMIWPIAMGLSFAITGIGFMITDMQTTVVAIERVKTVFDLPQETSGHISKVENNQPIIEMKNLTFSYEEGKPVLNCINLTINKGEKVAFVGGSGSGKSTLVKLLLRFYEVEKGSLLLFGEDIQDYTLSTLRKQFAYVAQNSHLLSGSIYDNILIVNPSSTKEQVVSSAKAAYADGFINKLPDGYETQVGERGNEISGGQRQRVAIARAFLKNSPIIIFDEITASLDGKSEAEVQKAIDCTPDNKTIIMITHRLASAVSADRIIVLKDGNIVEEGSFDELILKNGEFKELYDNQFDEN